MAKKEIQVKGNAISLFEANGNDYVSLPDMARGFGEPKELIQRWMRNRNTLDFLFFWERSYNTSFIAEAYDDIIEGVGRNTFKVSIKEWLSKTAAIGLYIKKGKYGGTYAHPDIASEFGMWLSPEFKVLLIKEFRRLKTEEAIREGRDWQLGRQITRLNYHIHTDSIKTNLIPPDIQKYPDLASPIYAREADVLNIALFGKTASEWRSENPSKDGNMRDYASITQLLILNNLQGMNSLLIAKGVSQRERLIELNAEARRQFATFSRVQNSVNKLNKIGEKPDQIDWGTADFE